MRLVVVESPYAPKAKKPNGSCHCDFGSAHNGECDYCIAMHAWKAELDGNLAYLRAAMRDCFDRGESPFASHGLYTQDGVLDDTIPEERTKGIEAGFAWRRVSDAIVVYNDKGMSRGMYAGVDDAIKHGRPIEYRTLRKY